MADTLPLRIVLLRPTPGIAFAIQSGKAELLPPSASSADALIFDVCVRLGSPKADGAPSLMPPIAQGPAHDRFVYVNAGQLAGQTDSPWNRRAKIKTAGISQELVNEVLSTPGAVLEARVDGTGRGGGPPAGTVPLLDVWQVVRRGG